MESKAYQKEELLSFFIKRKIRRIRITIKRKVAMEEIKDHIIPVKVAKITPILNRPVLAILSKTEERAANNPMESTGLKSICPKVKKRNRLKRFK